MTLRKIKKALQLCVLYPTILKMILYIKNTFSNYIIISCTYKLLFIKNRQSLYLEITVQTSIFLLLYFCVSTSVQMLLSENQFPFKICLNRERLNKQIWLKKWRNLRIYHFAIIQILYLDFIWTHNDDKHESVKICVKTKLKWFANVWVRIKKLVFQCQLLCLKTHFVNYDGEEIFEEETKTFDKRRSGRHKTGKNTDQSMKSLKN